MVGLRRIFRGSWSNGVNGTWSLGFSTRGTTKGRSPPGDQILTRSSRSLMCVSSFDRRMFLTFRFQKELATRPNTVVFTVRRDAANTHPTVSSVRNDVVNAHTSVSDDQRNELIHPQDAHDQDWTVRLVLYLSPSNHLPLPCRLTLGQRSRLKTNPGSNICIQRI